MFCFLVGIALVIIGGFSLLFRAESHPVSTDCGPLYKTGDPLSCPSGIRTSPGHTCLPSFCVRISAEDFARIIKALSKIGTLQQMQEPVFEEIYSGDTPAGDKQIVLSYTVKASYTHGDAIITMSLLDREGSLEVYRFNVQSEALAR